MSSGDAADFQYVAVPANCNHRRQAAWRKLKPPPGGGQDGFWTVLTVLTVLTGLTADVVDEIDEVGFGRQRCQQNQSGPPSTQSILSTLSILSEGPPPLGGVANGLTI